MSVGYKSNSNKEMIRLDINKSYILSTVDGNIICCLYVIFPHKFVVIDVKLCSIY